MKVSTVTGLPPAPRRLALVLGTNGMDFAVPTKLTEATHSVVMSQGAFSPVIRRCVARHHSLFGELARLKASPFNRRQTRGGPSSVKRDVLSVVAGSAGICPGSSRVA